MFLGVRTRLLMRSNSYKPSYYSYRKQHVLLGVLTWFLVKVKLFIKAYYIDWRSDLGMIFQISFLVYFLIIFLIRVVLELYIKRSHKRWIHHKIEPNEKLFDSDVKK